MAKPSVRARMEIVDVADFIRRLGTLQSVVRIQILRGLDDHAQSVFRQSQEEVPVKTGTLRASGVLESAKMIGDVFIVEIRYTRDYAFSVHENRFISHNHGKAGYLADPINEQAPELLDRIGKRIKEVI